MVGVGEDVSIREIARFRPHEMLAASDAREDACRPHPEPVLRMASNFHG